MKVQTGSSNLIDANEAVRELSEQLNIPSPTLVVYFVSPEYDQNAIAEAMKIAYPEAAVVGASTAGEICSGKMQTNSLVAMAFDKETVTECEMQLVYNIKTENHVQNALEKLEKRMQLHDDGVDSSSYVGMVLIDGLQNAEEKVMESIGLHSSIPFVGASAGDGLQFNKTWIHCDGKAINNAAVLVTLKTAQGFELLKTQSFKSFKKTLIATQVDEANRTVIEFNRKPASQAYAEALGIDESELIEKFMKHPVGLMLNGEIFVRSPQQVKGQSIVFYCAIKTGMELTVLEATNLIDTTKQVLVNKFKEIGKPSALINFNCILRTLELEEAGLKEKYADVFSDLTSIGFSTYGESFVSQHINQTSTMLLIK